MTYTNQTTPINAEEEPENTDYPKKPKFKKKFGPRGVIKSFAGGKIEDTGPLTIKRMETIDEEVLAMIQDFLGRAKKRVEPKHLAADAPNILIILMDDLGPGTASTYGGEINTPTLDRIAKLGVSYNRFHSTAMCSPRRAALLTGRNHTRVGNGQIAAIANDFDGFSGVIPKTSATVAEVLKDYGCNTSAFGKWHNTPEEQITSKGPFDYWSTGYGFEYSYGFLAGEASQWEPTLLRNTSYAEHPHTSGGLTCYMDKGHLMFEYNLMIIDRSLAKSREMIPPGKHTIVVDTILKVPKPGAPADIVLSVDGKEVARAAVKMTVPAAFTASESFDVGVDLGSPVSRDYFERRSFKFVGKISKVRVELK